MIALIIDPDSQALLRIFKKPLVIIGSEASGTADLTLPGEALQSNHVQISSENGSYTVFNVANDPFVTLNSLPFSKKKLSVGDLLQIGKTRIQFEGKVKEELIPEPPIRLDEAAKALERTFVHAEKEHSPVMIATPPMEPDADLWKEVESLAKNFDEPAQVKQPTATPPPPLSPKKEADVLAKEEADKNLRIGRPIDAPLEPGVYDLDDENTLISKEKQPPPPTEVHGRLWHWNLFFFALAVIALIVTLICGGVYISIAERHETEKILAAEGVADVAMALTYAQVNHIKPQKQNWSDPEFIKNNISSLLSTEYPSLSNLDNQGQFTNCPYILRIYTSSDLSHFLIIAQPEPSLLQWLLPKTAIAVDSHEMELRSVNEIKLLNRLLLSPNVLDGISGREVSSLIKQGSLIPLSYLAAKQKNPIYAPPKALSLIRPGAENRIYNAPRYYHFGENLLKKSVTILETTSNGYEVARLKQELQEFAQLPNVVLYSSEGMQEAMLAQKALGLLMPSHKFLTAYLNFNKEGNLTSSHLLMDDHPPILVEDSIKGEVASAEPILTPHARPEIDQNHPLFLQLTNLVSKRQQLLKPLNEKLSNLLHDNLEKTLPNFLEQFSAVFEQYEQIDREQRKHIQNDLRELYQHFPNLSLAQFTAYINAAGLESIAQGVNLNPVLGASIERFSTQEFIENLHEIELAQNLVSLEAIITKVVPMMNLSNISDANLLILYQHQLRVVTLQKIRHFVLTSGKGLPKEAFNEKNRTILIHILQSIWVNDPNEYDYYIHEFDLRMNH